MLSITEMAVLGAAALMFFGPEQLPKVARKAGLLIREVQNTSQSFIREMERAADEPAGGSATYSRAGLIEEAVSPNGTAYAAEPYVHPYVEPAYDPVHDAVNNAVHDTVHDVATPHAASAPPADHDLPP